MASADIINLVLLKCLLFAAVCDSSIFLRYFIDMAGLSRRGQKAMATARKERGPAKRAAPGSAVDFCCALHVQWCAVAVCVVLLLAVFCSHVLRTGGAGEAALHF